MPHTLIPVQGSPVHFAKVPDGPQVYECTEHYRKRVDLYMGVFGVGPVDIIDTQKNIWS